MTVQDLIAELQKVTDPHTKVFVWVDGNRMPVASIDWLDDYIDINAIPDGILAYHI
jgi:hypothetical protein